MAMCVRSLRGMPAQGGAMSRHFHLSRTAARTAAFRAAAAFSVFAMAGAGLAACGSQDSSTSAISAATLSATGSTTPATDACSTIPTSYIQETSKAYTLSVASDCAITVKAVGESLYNSMLYKDGTLKQLDGGAMSWDTDASVTYTYVPQGALTKDSFADIYAAVQKAGFSDSDMAKYAWLYYLPDGGDSSSAEIFREYSTEEASASASASASAAASSASAYASSGSATDASGSSE